jgi:hypothetical protein
MSDAGERREGLRKRNKNVAAGFAQVHRHAIDAAANELLAAGDGCYANDPPVVRLVSGFAGAPILSGVQLIEQRLRLLQIKRVEPLVNQP